MKYKVPRQIIENFIIGTFDYKTTASGEFRINSIYDSDNKYHMYVNPENGMFKDFKSNIGGSFTRLISDYFQMDNRIAILHVLRKYSANTGFIFEEEQAKKINAELKIPEGLTWFKNYEKGFIGDQALRYLFGRNIEPNVINEFGYIYNPGEDNDKTIFIPFYENGELVYYICRSFLKDPFRRYVNPVGIDSKQFVYNIDLVEDEVFIFEGVFDAITLKDQVGVAMLSADLGKNQAMMIMDKAPKVVVFIPDNDETGASTLEKNIKLLLEHKAPSVATKILVYEIKGFKDLNASGITEIDLKDCIDYRSYLMSKMMEVQSAKSNNGM